MAKKNRRKNNKSKELTIADICLSEKEKADIDFIFDSVEKISIYVAKSVTANIAKHANLSQDDSIKCYENYKKRFIAQSVDGILKELQKLSNQIEHRRALRVLKDIAENVEKKFNI